MDLSRQFNFLSLEIISRFWPSTFVSLESRTYQSKSSNFILCFYSFWNDKQMSKKEYRTSLIWEIIIFWRIGRFQTLFRWILKDSRISTGHVTLFFISESVFIANLMIKSKFRNPNFLESIGIKFETNHWTQHIV